MSEHFCPECNRKIDVQTTICIYCGAPIHSEVVIPSSSQSSSSSLLKNGTYRLICPVTQGSLGSVLQAENTDTGEIVAVKIIRDAFRDERSEEEKQSDFSRSVETLRKLEHPGLPEIVDAFREHDCSYLVTTFIHGCDLNYLLKQSATQHPPLEKALKSWFFEISRIIKYLLKSGIPAKFDKLNLSHCMLGLDNKIYLVDFGIKQILENPGNSGKGDKVHSELAGKERVDESDSDLSVNNEKEAIEALGRILYQLLTGIDPLDPSKEYFGLPDISVVRPDIPAHLGKLVMSMMSGVKIPGGNHPGTIDEISAKLREHMEKYTLEKSQKPSSGERVVRRSSTGSPELSLKTISLVSLSLLFILFVSLTLFALLTGSPWDMVLINSVKTLILISAVFLLLTSGFIVSGNLTPDMTLTGFVNRFIAKSTRNTRKD